MSLNMIVIKGNIRELEPLTEPVALTLGNFDGVHKGHIHLLQILREKAHDQGLKMVVMTFDPHPHSLLGNSHFKPLQTETMKMKHLEKQGVDCVVIQNFDRLFSDVSKEDFLSQYLMSFFELRFLLFGYDFSFGRKGEGDFDFTGHFLKNRNIGIYQSRAFREDGEVVSSSKIRDLLTGGKIEKAKQETWLFIFCGGKGGQGEVFGEKIGFSNSQSGRGFLSCSRPRCLCRLG